MLANKNQRDAGRSIFLSSVIGLSNVVAFVAAFLGQPIVYGHSIGWVQRYTVQHYGTGFEDLTAMIWFVVCALILFFGARASVATALVMGGLALAARMF